MMPWIEAWAGSFWTMMVEAGLWLGIGFLLAGVIGAAVPPSLMGRWLGGRGIGAMLRASLIGMPMPLCSCSVVPAAAGLRRAGAGRGPTTSFLVSTPEVDLPSVSITWAMIGPGMAAARPIVAFATAIAAGLGVQASGKDEPGTDTRQPDSAQGSSCDAEGCSCAPSPAAPPTRRQIIARTVRHTLVDLPHDLGHWMLLGLALSAVLIVAVPQEWIEQQVETGVLGPIGGKLVMLVLGVPWYVCATATTPLAAALIAKGLSPGAALVLLLVGPATNPATMGWVWGELGARALAAYLAVVSGMALASGFALDAIDNAGWLGSFAGKAVQATHHAGSRDAGIAAQIAGGAMLALLAWGVMRRLGLRLRAHRGRPGSCCT